MPMSMPDGVCMRNWRTMKPRNAGSEDAELGLIGSGCNPHSRKVALHTSGALCVVRHGSPTDRGRSLCHAAEKSLGRPVTQARIRYHRDNKTVMVPIDDHLRQEVLSFNQAGKHTAPALNALPSPGTRTSVSPAHCLRFVSGETETGGCLYSRSALPFRA